MNLLKKLLIIVTLFIFTIVLYKIWFSKKKYIQYTSNEIQEGLSPNHKNYNGIIDGINKIAIDAKEFPPGYLSIHRSLRKLELKHFCIKSSFNSAYDGKNYVSDEMVKYVLSRGCRLLHFEVFFINDEPYIGYSNYSSDSVMSSELKNSNPIKLTTMMISVLSNAFVTQPGEKYYCTNIEDPLFIYLTLKTGQTSNIKEYGYVSKALEAVYRYGGGRTLNKYFYGKKVTKDTPIGDICGKVIFICNNDDSDNMGYTNMTNAEDSVIIKTYADIDNEKISPNPPSAKSMSSNEVNLDKLTLVTIKDSEYNTKDVNNNYQIYPIIKNFGCNFALFKYYDTDWKLLNCEKLFKHYNNGIIPMTYALSYINIYPSSDQLLLSIGIN